MGGGPQVDMEIRRPMVAFGVMSCAATDTMTQEGYQMRINARLDDIQARMLDYLRASTGQTLSDVVKAAIERYYAEVSAAPTRAAEVLERTGFIGCFDADPDLSADYKHLLGASLDAKHDHR